MKIQLLFGLSVAALFLVACGDDVTKVTNVTNEVSGMEIAKSADSLEKCVPENFGKTVFVSDENTAYICADSAWKKLLPTSEKSSCEVKALSDSSGFKIVCDGDSVGTILSEKAAGCKLFDGGDGSLVQVCGDDSTTFHIALCGDVPYKTDSEFCHENTVYAKCGEEIYSVGKDVCLDKKVYKNKALAWKNMNPDIDYEVFTDDRDGQVYRSVQIGEQTWMAENLNLEYTAGQGSACAERSEENCDKFGRIYLWSSAMDSAAVYGETGKGCGDGDTVCVDTVTVRGICPEGWHLPDTTEWIQLLDFVASELKDSIVHVSSYGVYDENVSKTLVSSAFGGNDKYGFGAVLAKVYANPVYYSHTLFYSSSKKTQADLDEDFMAVAISDMNASYTSYLAESSMYGMMTSIRCLKD